MQDSYTSVVNFNQTRINITVNLGAKYTVSIQVMTRHGRGKVTQVSVVVPSYVPPVENLIATVDKRNEALVHLSWSPPSPTARVQVSRH